MATREGKGVSLAKGPIALLGMASLVYGILGFVFGGQSFSVDIPSGTIGGESFLGVEANGWSNLLFIASGALLLFGAPVHWGAKSMGIIVGLGLGAASVIAIVDGDDVLGIFAANGLTKLVWGAGSVALLVLALLPRVGGAKQRDEASDVDGAAPGRDGERRFARRPEREPVAGAPTSGSRSADGEGPR